MGCLMVVLLIGAAGMWADMYSPIVGQVFRVLLGGVFALVLVLFSVNWFRLNKK